MLVGLAKTVIFHWEAVVLTAIITMWGGDIALLCEPLATYVLQVAGDPFGWLEPIPGPMPGFDPTAETYYV